MLNRFFSKKEKAKSGPVEGQGSLLNLLDEQQRANSTVIDFPTGQPASGSLLNAINESEAASERSRQLAYAEQLAQQQQTASIYPQASPHAHEPVYQSAADVAAHPATAANTSHAQSEQQAQLDLLSRELEDLAARARIREETEHKRDVEPKRPKARSAGFAAARENLVYRPTSSPFGFESVVSALLRGWWVIVACGLIGAFIAALYALSLPNKYLSVAELLIEPRGVKVIENSVSPDGLNREATVAYAESQVRILTSSSVLDPVIEELELAEDPEFNGTSPSGGLFGMFTDMIFGAENDPGEKFAAAKDYLYKNMFVSRINQTFTIQIGVTTEDPKKSARIANAIARGYMTAESSAKSSAARSATKDLTGRLDELRAQVRMSEEKVEAYKAENGLVDAEGKLVSEVQLARLNDQLAVVQAQASDARSRAEQAAEADLSDVLSGSLPTALASPTISQLRVQYSRAKSRLDRISTTLGPRHPERIGAQAELRSARQAIASELSRTVESAQEDYRSARSRLADIQGQVNTLKANAVTDSAAKVKLRELERDVDANRRVYETYLLRSRETGEQENIRTGNARVISEATPPVEKEGPNRKLITIAGGMAGGVIGMLLALIPFLFGAMREMMSGERVRPEKEYQAAAYDDDLYSSNAGEDTFAAARPPVQDERVEVASPPIAPRSPYRDRPSASVDKRQTNEAVTREDLEELRQQMQADARGAAAPAQMPLFAQPQPQPQPYMAYPQPQPIYPSYPAAMPVMQPVAYAPVQPVMPQPMPQPMPMAYPVWPQQGAAADDKSK